MAQGTIDLLRPELPWMIRRSRQWSCSRVFALHSTRPPPRPAPNCHSRQIWIKAPSKSRQKRPSLGPDGPGPKPRLSQPQGSSRNRGTEECDILAFAGFLEPFHLGGSPIRPVLWGQRVELGQQRGGVPLCRPRGLNKSFDSSQAPPSINPGVDSGGDAVPPPDRLMPSRKPHGSGTGTEAPVTPGRAVSASSAGFCAPATAGPCDRIADIAFGASIA